MNAAVHELPLHERVLYESHAHTPMCGHAVGTPSAYCEQAIKRGLRGIVFTEHNPMPLAYGHGSRIPNNQIGAYLAMIRRTARQYKLRLRVLSGIECDYLPEYDDFLREQVGRHQFAYVIGSVHCQLPAFQRHITKRTPDFFLRTYLDFLARAAESGLFHTLAHPHMGQLMAKNHPLPADALEECLDRIAATGVGIEINTVGITRWDHQLYFKAARRSIPIVLAGDAHHPSHVGDGFMYALQFVRSMGYTHVRQPIGDHKINIPITRALEVLMRVPMR